MTAPPMTDGPLTGIRVVDLTVATRGPPAAYLADMGADVVKVERTMGELSRYVRGPGFTLAPEVMAPQYVAMNRGKRGIAVDADSALGREVLVRLVAKADVFVTNYRREALERMGLGYAQLAPDNPRLVYAVSQGSVRWVPMRTRRCSRRGAGPRSLGHDLRRGGRAANAAGRSSRRSCRSMQLALGVMTALYARERTGRGQEVNTSALGAMMWIQAWEIAHSSMSDEPLRRDGVHNPSIRCPYGVYETSDGGAILFVVAMSDTSWDDFWVFAGEPDAVLDRRWSNVAKRIGARARWTASPRSATGCAVCWPPRPPRSGSGSSQRNPRSSGSGCRTTTSCSAIRRWPPTATSPVSTSPASAAQVVTNVVHLGDTPGAGVRRRAPLLGEHTAEVMRELAFADDEIEEILAAADGAAGPLIALVYDD